MSNVYWGQPTWVFFHTLAEKIKEENFDDEKIKIFNIIANICNNLPCPDCKLHASMYIKKNKLTNIKSKHDLKKYFFTFHNEVNRRIKVEEKKIEYLEVYKTNNLKDIFINFVKQFSKPVYNNRLMMDSLNRNLIMKEVIKYFQENLNKFED